MTIEILTVLPELLESPFAHSIMKRAQERGHLDIKLHQLRNWAINKHGQVDDYQYGGGAGMVMMCEDPAQLPVLQEMVGPLEKVYRVPGGVASSPEELRTFIQKWVSPEQ